MYSIISKTYELIGRPIDNIATLINNCDQKVWDIYEKGLTTTINQVDSDMGKQLIQRYKPKSLAELSAWVAAIRPGFASLLNNFLDRKPYSTGVSDLDDLLNDSFHYLLYQESIMSYLVWLGMEEKSTYDIIKKISKKKFKEEELIELKNKLLEGWMDRIGVEDGFAETWKVVEDAAHYSFNASHSLSVAIDSLYGAYLKSHYPLEYYTVALSLYQDDMLRTANLTNELKEFNIKINNIEFGKSKGDYMMDRNTNSIYKGIASIKYCNHQIADELYDLSQKKKYDNFIELLKDINDHTSVNSKQLTILIVLDYFKKFGKNKYLLDIVELCNGKKEKNKIVKPALLTCKQLSKDKLDSYDIPYYLVKKYSDNETAKQFSKIDNIGLIKELVDRLENNPLSVVEQVKFEMDYLNYCIYVNPRVHQDYYIVIEYKHYKEARKPYVTLHHVKTGEDIKTKVTNVKTYENNPFGLYSVLKVKSFTEKNKTKLVDGVWQSVDETELILSDYEVVK